MKCDLNRAKIIVCGTFYETEGVIATLVLCVDCLPVKGLILVAHALDFPLTFDVSTSHLTLDTIADRLSAFLVNRER